MDTTSSTENEAMLLDATLTVPEQEPSPTQGMNSYSNSSSHSNNNTMESLILEDLVKLISLPPSKESLLKLTSTMMTTNIQNTISSSSSTVNRSSLHHNQQQQQQHQEHDTIDADAVTTTKTSQPLSSLENIMIAYLRAVAHHLQILLVPSSTSSQQQPTVDTTSSAAAAAVTTTVPNNINIDDCAYTILPVISGCITQLTSISCNRDDRASIISDTGILESLWYMVDHYDSNIITNFACEFLEACILCQQYSFALQRIVHTWPVPKKTISSMNSNVIAPPCSADTILRYYYLRGIVCMGCGRDKAATITAAAAAATMNSNNLAIRCFWTCLSIPSKSGANTVSCIAVAAYKKLILLQALSPLGIMHTTMIQINGDNKQKGTEDTNNNNNNNTSDNSSTSVIMPSTGGMSPIMPSISIPSATNPLSTPKEMSWDLVRFISQANPPALVSSSSSQQSAGTTTPTTARHNVKTQNVGSMNTEKSISRRNQYTYPHYGVHVYLQLIRAFVAIDRKKFNNIMNEHTELFHKDGNYGCIYRLSNALYYRQLYVISRSYSSIPLQQLCSELISLPIDHVHELLQKLQTKLSWPVKVISVSSVEGMESEEVVFFPSYLPRPIMFMTTEESTMGPHHQMLELAQKMHQVNAMIESSSKYKTASTYYDQRQKHQKSTKNDSASIGTTSMVLEDSF